MDNHYGKVNYFKNKYQITNPDYVTTSGNKEYVIKNIPKYNLTKGINEKKYRSISEQVIDNMPSVEDWLSEDFIRNNNFNNWNNTIRSLHKSKDSKKKTLIVLEDLFLMNYVLIL